MIFLKRMAALSSVLFLFVGPNLKEVKCIEDVDKPILTESKSMSGNAGNDDECDYTHTLRKQMYNYFYNLYDYSPENYYGTCGYVSLTQVLSYYDNFYDDRIIEKEYNKYKNNQSSYLLDSELVSPGVTRGEYKNQYGSFSDTVTATCSFDYQYELVRRYKNYQSSRSINKYRSIVYNNSLPVENAAEIVNNCLTYKPSKVTLYSSDELTQNEYSIKIKNAIDDGKPVIVNIKNTSSDSGHAVVAYDYTSSNIYANFGWNNYETHKPLTYNNYNKIIGILILEFNSHDGSISNYEIEGNKIDYLSFYNRAVLNPTKYQSSNGYPTFVWKHSTDNSEYFDVKIGVLQTDGQLNELISGTTSYNRFILSYQATQYLYGAAQTGKGIYISIKRYEKNGLVKYNFVTSYFY